MGSCTACGVTQDIIGNVFLEAITTLDWPGRSMADKVKTLWLRMQSFYKANRTNNRLQSVTLNTFRPFPNQPPKLKAKGGETRGLVGFGVILANELHHKHGSDHTLRVKNIMEDLAAIYKLMFTQYTPTEARKLSMQVAFWYSKLEQGAKANNIVAWKIQPKLHMMQELLEYQSFELGNPRGYWEYHDEDFVGQVAKIAVRKGGRVQPRPAPRLSWPVTGPWSTSGGSDDTGPAGKNRPNATHTYAPMCTGPSAHTEILVDTCVYYPIKHIICYYMHVYV